MAAHVYCTVAGAMVFKYWSDTPHEIHLGLNEGVIVDWQYRFEVQWRFAGV
jgi:hypothetical protein